MDKYRLRCITEDKYEFVWGSSAPTSCPVNAAHTIDADSITIVSEGGVPESGDLANTLEDAKAAKFIEIDTRTQELIAQGFTYASKTFSTSQAAQARMMGINQIRNDPAVTYPIKWNTLDDNDVHELADAAEVLSFYLTGVGTYRAHVDSGTSIKDQVRAATTIAEVEAIVDPR